MQSNRHFPLQIKRLICIKLTSPAKGKFIKLIPKHTFKVYA